VRRRALAPFALAALLAALACSPASANAAVSRTAALRIAAGTAAVQQTLRSHPHAYPQLGPASAGVWQVNYFAGDTEVVEVQISQATGTVLATYTGVQAAWSMARGYAGAFGRAIDALYIWIPLCLLFVAPFFNWRRPASMLNLDLLVLLSLSVSLAFFNNADIAASVPLVYPPLIYLLARLLWIAWCRGRRTSVLALRVPVSWLAVAVCLLGAFRIGLNVANSNVIDVGYANVVGAQQLVNGKPLYGDFPAVVAHGDTYGPVSYEAYVPFVTLFGLAPSWNSLPAAHAAAIVFDLLCLVLLFLLGRQIRGPSMGVVLAYAWVAYPFTAFALESNTNDGLVAALILAALVAANSPAGRGLLAALAGLAKFAPLALAPLLLTHRLVETRWRGLALFATAFALAGALALAPALAHDSLHEIYARTIAYQATRSAPFSLWGLYGGLRSVQTAVQVFAVALAVAVALAPRRPDVIGLAACAAAVLIAVQLGVTYWFYLYIPWFFAPAAVALFGRHEQLLDGVGPKWLRAAHHDAHQPRVLV
jgi:hypothetical protein